MFNYKITCDNGTTTIIRARNSESAMMLFCKAEGCSAAWFAKHCIVKKMKEV